MNEIEENHQKVKKPTFLIVLIVLSCINIIFSLYNNINSTVAGPLTENELEENVAVIYSSISQLQEEGAQDDVLEMFEVIAENMRYVNNEAFFLNQYLNLFMLALGCLSIYLMFQLKKIGFHLYIAYNLMPIAIIYIVSPADLIPNLYIIIYVVIAAIFSILYGINLKHFKD